MKIKIKKKKIIDASSIYVMPKIAIVIVTYNGEKYLPDCLASLKNQNYSAVDIKIIIVDNGSTDKSVEYVKQNYPEFTLILNNKNEGYAAGNNLGIREAFGCSPDFVVLLNQDTVAEKNWLKELAQKAVENPRAGALQSLLLLWDEKNLIQTDGNHIHYLGFGFSGDYKNQRPTPNAQRPKEIAYASGAAVLFKANVLKEIGLFDEDLFAYHEDLDLGWRVRLAGYKILLVPSSVVYHKYSFSRNKLKNYYMERNRFMVLLKNYKSGTILCILPALLLMELGMVSYAFLDGWGREKIKSYKAIMAGLPSIWKKRKEIQRKRKAGDREIVRLFSGKIEFAELQNPVLKYLVNPILNLYWQIIKRFIRW